MTDEYVVQFRIPADKLTPAKIAKKIKSIYKDACEIEVAPHQFKRIPEHTASCREDWSYKTYYPKK